MKTILAVLLVALAVAAIADNYTGKFTPSQSSNVAYVEVSASSNQVNWVVIQRITNAPNPTILNYTNLPTYQWWRLSTVATNNGGTNVVVAEALLKPGGFTITEQ